MIGPVFVDTNVLVYSRDARAPQKRASARAWLEHLWRERIGRTSMQVLNEYYNTLTRKIRPALPAEIAWDSVSALLAWNPQPIDRDVLQQGRGVEARYHLAWWDSLVVAAAQLQSCAILLTEDLQDGCSFGSVTVLNPFKSGVAEAQATYRYDTQAVRLHRARGRPRRAQPSR